MISSTNPGITPLVADFARKVADRGMTAVLPDLFGTPGRPVSLPYVLSSFARICVSKEFTLLALNKTSPVVDYLRELAAHEHEACGGPGVGAPDERAPTPAWRKNHRCDPSVSSYFRDVHLPTDAEAIDAGTKYVAPEHSFQRSLDGPATAQRFKDPRTTLPALIYR